MNHDHDFGVGLLISTAPYYDYKCIYFYARQKKVYLIFRVKISSLWFEFRGFVDWIFSKVSSKVNDIRTKLVGESIDDKTDVMAFDKPFDGQSFANFDRSSCEEVLIFFFIKFDLDPLPMSSENVKAQCWYLILLISSTNRYLNVLFHRISRRQLRSLR